MPTRAVSRKAERTEEQDREARDRALAKLNQQIEDITEGLWKQKDLDFYEERTWLERVKDRRELIELDDKFKEYGQGIQDLSPMLEDDLVQNVMLLNLDNPRLDCISKETSLEGKREVEESQMWLAQSMDRQNIGKTLGRGVNTDQWMKGVACVEKRWHAPAEPDEDHYKSQMGDDYYDPKDTEVPEAAKADKRDKIRVQHFQSQRDHCFSMNLVNMNEMSWGPKLLEPDVYLRQFQISYTEAREIKQSKKLRKDGKAGNLNLDAMGKIVFLGESGNDENGNDETHPDKYFDCVIRNERRGKEWWCTEWIKSADTEWTEGEQYDEYRIPAGMPMYFIIPSGNMNPTATNPHLMYRAPAYSEAVLVHLLNYLNTLEDSLARMQLTDNFMYLPGNKLNADVLTAAESAGFVFEGAGESRGMVLRRPMADATELQVLPGEIAAWPFPDIKTIKERKAQIFMDLEKVRPNRMQTGEALSVAKEGTAYGLRDQKQASAVPYEAHIDYEELFWMQSAEWERRAIIDWAAEGGTSKPFYYRTNGKEPAMNSTMGPGKEIYIDADKMKRDFEIFVEKRNKTQDEEYQDQLIAFQLYDQGIITETQRLKRAGFDDPERQETELQREKYRKMVEAELAPAEAMMVKVYFSYLFGNNVAELPLPAGATPPGGNPSKPPGANLPAAQQVYQPQMAIPPAQGIGSFGSQADPTAPI